MEYQFSNRMSGLKPSAIREIFKVTQDPEVISFAAGNPSPDSFPIRELKDIAADLFENSGKMALQYGMTEGYGPLRDITRERISRKYSVGGEGDDLIITSGGQQTIELAAKVLLNEAMWSSVRSPALSARSTPSAPTAPSWWAALCRKMGSTPSAWSSCCARRRRQVDLYHSNLPESLRPHHVPFAPPPAAELAEEYNVLIIEDSPYFELRYSGEPGARHQEHGYQRAGHLFRLLLQGALARHPPGICLCAGGHHQQDGGGKAGERRAHQPCSSRWPQPSI